MGVASGANESSAASASERAKHTVWLHNPRRLCCELPTLRRPLQSAAGSGDVRCFAERLTDSSRQGAKGKKQGALHITTANYQRGCFAELAPLEAGRSASCARFPHRPLLCRSVPSCSSEMSAGDAGLCPASCSSSTRCSWEAACCSNIYDRWRGRPTTVASCGRATVRLAVPLRYHGCLTMPNHLGLMMPRCLVESALLATSGYGICAF